MIEGIAQFIATGICGGMAGWCASDMTRKFGLSNWLGFLVLMPLLLAAVYITRFGLW